MYGRAFSPLSASTAAHNTTSQNMFAIQSILFQSTHPVNMTIDSFSFKRFVGNNFFNKSCVHSFSFYHVSTWLINTFLLTSLCSSETKDHLSDDLHTKGRCLAVSCFGSWDKDHGAVQGIFVLFMLLIWSWTASMDSSCFESPFPEVPLKSVMKGSPQCL